VANSRGTGKRDHVIAEGANPGDAQLRERNALPIRNSRQSGYELEFDSRPVCQQGRPGWTRKGSYIILGPIKQTHQIADSIV
jgi:hypothetical protein